MSRATFRKIIVTPKLLKQINNENKRLVELFLREKASRASKTTIKKYQSDANIFMCWNVLYNENKLFTQIKKLDLANFFSFATESLHWGSARNNSLRSLLSSLSIFIERFLDDEFPEFHNIILKTIEATPKELRREKTILSEKQVIDLLKYLSETDSQKACWVALAAYSGSRFSELLRFTVDLVDINHTAFGDIFLETTRQIKTKGRGHDGKLLYKYILRDKFLPYYKQWLKDREEIIKKNNQNHLSLFIKSDGTPATDGTVRSWISSIERHLGINFYCHALRHFLVTEFSRKNIPSQLIKDIVGWSGLEMVNLYNDLSSRDKEWVELENLK
jgi:site-specific recombinase XerD